jgi:hypothetical protein
MREKCSLHNRFPEVSLGGLKEIKPIVDNLALNKARLLGRNGHPY